MALLFMDSFDHYATADLAEKWTSVENVARLAIGAYGRNSTNGLLISNHSSGTYAYATVLGGVSEVIVGVAIKPATFTGAQGAVPICFGSASKWECGLSVNADLTVQPFRANHDSYIPGYQTDYGYGVLIGSASTVALQVGVWSYLELRMVCSDTVGTCLVRINGVEVLNLTGLDTKYSDVALTRVALGSKNNAYAVFHFDDIVVMDTAGAVNNSFLGDVTVSALYPSGAGTTSGWTPSAGSNYACVDEASPNDDTDYNATATVNAKDTYAFANAPAGADIRAVQVLAAVRKGAEGPGQVKLVTRSSSTDYDGAAQGIGGTSYSYVREVLETDPATAAAWSESGFNAAEFGIKKTA